MHSWFFYFSAIFVGTLIGIVIVFYAHLVAFIGLRQANALLRFAFLGRPK